MNMTRKTAALAALCLLCTGSHAQEQQPSAGSAAALQQKWFAFSPEDATHSITLELNRDERLVIRLGKPGHWPTAADFSEALTAADQAMAAYRDSLQEQQTLTLDIYQPGGRRNLITRLRRDGDGSSLMTIGQDGASALKLGTDTLRILQRRPGQESKGKDTARVQYTFLLKQLGNYSTYAQDEQWRTSIAAAIDTLSAAARVRYTNKPDAPRHQQLITYRVSDRSSTMETGRRRMNVLVIDGGFGVSLIRNTLCPNAEYGIAAYIHRDEESRIFVRTSISAFLRFSEISPDRYKAYGTGFVNLEFGGESNHSNPNSLFYKTSLGVGYKLINKKEEDRDPSMSKHMYRLFFNYSVNKFLVVTPEVVTNFKKNDRYNGWLGLSLNIRLF